MGRWFDRVQQHLRARQDGESRFLGRASSLIPSSPCFDGCATPTAQDAGEEKGDDANPKIPMLKISAMVAITGMMPSTKRAMTMPRDLILPPLPDSDFGMIRLRCHGSRGRLKP